MIFDARRRIDNYEVEATIFNERLDFFVGHLQRSRNGKWRAASGRRLFQIVRVCWTSRSTVATKRPPCTAATAKFRVVVDLHDPPLELEIVSKYAFFRSRELLLPRFPLLFVPSFGRVLNRSSPTSIGGNAHIEHSKCRCQDELDPLCILIVQLRLC